MNEKKTGYRSLGDYLLDIERLVASYIPSTQNCLVTMEVKIPISIVLHSKVNWTMECNNRTLVQRGELREAEKK